MRRRMCSRALFFSVLLTAAVAGAAAPRTQAPTRRPLDRSSADTGAIDPDSDPLTASDPIFETSRAPNTPATTMNRIEFVSFQLAYGVFDGIVISRVMSPPQFQLSVVYAAFPFIEAGIRGFGAIAWGALRPEFTESEGMIINAATWWANAWSVLLAYAIEGNHLTYPALLGSIAGLAGSVAGAVIGTRVDLEPGAIAMANSGGAWTAAIAYFLCVPWVQSEADWKLTFGLVDLASIAGFAAGLVASRFGVPTRASVLWTDLGALVGYLAGGLATSVLKLSPSTSPGPFAMLVGGSTALGLGVGAALTWALGVRSSRSPMPSLSVSPIGRDGFGLAVQSTF